MSSSAALHTQLAAVMESLVHAAVAELQKLVEDSWAFRTGDSGNQTPQPATRQAESRKKMVQFAVVMETLGNEALGKILNIVDETRLQVERSGRKSQTRVLNILNNRHVELEHSYGVPHQSSHPDQACQTKAEAEETAEVLFVQAVTIKDEYGNVDLGAIAEREMLMLCFMSERGGVAVRERWPVLASEVPAFPTKSKGIGMGECLFLNRYYGNGIIILCLLPNTHTGRWAVLRDAVSWQAEKSLHESLLC